MLDSIENEWFDYHEHERPSRLGGRSASTHEHQSPGCSETERQEEERRFARDVCHWIDRARTQESNDEALVVFAAPGLFGTLRHAIDAAHVDVREAELTTLRPDELATHPAVREALSRPAPFRIGG